jgi:membrane protein DedA with SNARE-associated domain
MIQFLDNIFRSIDPVTAYLILFLSAFAENVVPPIPGDTVVLLGAYLVSTSRLDFLGVYLATTFGSAGGFAAMYLVGRYAGHSFLQSRRGRRWFKQKYLEKARSWFARWGYWIIIVNRFLSGTRSVISLFAGLFHLRPVPVFMLALLGSAIWNALLITGGVMLGRNWQLLEKWISRYNQVLLILLLAGIGYWLVRRFYLKAQRNKGTEAQRNRGTKE